MEGREDYIYHAGLNFTHNQLLHHFLSQQPEFKAQHQIFTYIPPPLIVIGTIGNLLCCYVINRCNLHREPTGFYMALLCFVNSVILLAGCGLHWVSYTTQTPYIANLTDWTCRMWQCFFNILLYFSPWLVVAMMIERYIYLYHPKKRDTLCCIFAAKVCIIIITIGLLCVAIHALWTYELSPVNDQCFVDQKLHFFHTKVWPWISAIVYVYLPILALVAFQLFIILALLPSDCHPSRVTQSGPHNSKLTKASLAISIIYIFLTLPTIVINLLEYCKPSLYHNIDTKAKLMLGRVIVQTLACLDHSVTFIVCFIFLPMIRQETLDLFGCFCRKGIGRSYQLTSIECTTEEITQENGEAKGSTMV